MSTPIYILESQDLNSASVMVEAYRDELVKCRLVQESMLLKGVEIFTVDDAITALSIVRSIPTSDEDSIRQYVIVVLERAIEAGNTASFARQQYAS